MDNKKYIGFFMPAEVEEDKNLNEKEKRLVSKIMCVNNCFMTNKVIASQLGCSITYVSNLINGLIEKGYLKKISEDSELRLIKATFKNAPLFREYRKQKGDDVLEYYEEKSLPELTEEDVKNIEEFDFDGVKQNANPDNFFGKNQNENLKGGVTNDEDPLNKSLRGVKQIFKGGLNKSLTIKYNIKNKEKYIIKNNINNRDDIFPEQISTTSNEVSLESKDSVNVGFKNENLDFNNSPNNEPLEGPTITSQPVEPKTTKPSTISELVKYYNIPTEEYGRKLSHRELQMRVDEFEVAERLAAHKQKMELKKQLEEENTIKFSQNEPKPLQIQNTQPQTIEKPSLSSFKGSLTASNNENTQSTIIEPKSSQIANKQAKPYANTSKAYYDTLKELKTPIRNHNNLRGYIKRLEDELGEKIAVKYLDFLKNVYPILNDDGFKPTISESIDIYAKRESISNWVKKQSNKKPNLI